MSVTKRRLLIEFDDDESEFTFTRRVADLRDRYPTWRITAVTSAQTFIAPSKPRSALTGMKGGETSAQPHQLGTIDAYLAGLAPPSALPRKKSGDVDADWTAVSDHAAGGGNVVGEVPVDLRKGMRVRCMAPPFVGRDGTLLDYKGQSALIGVRMRGTPAASAPRLALPTQSTHSHDNDRTEEDYDTWWYHTSDLRVVAEHCNCTAALHYDDVCKGLIAAADALLRTYRAPQLPAAVAHGLLHV